MRQKSQYLECGKVVGTHGVRGMVRMESRCDSPAVLAGLKTMYRKEKDGSYSPMKVLRASVQKTMVLASFAGVETLEDAISLRDQVLYVDRADFHLEEGDYFIADLLGLPIIDTATGQPCGTLKDVRMPGAHQVYVVADGAEEFMIPNVPEFILEISFGEDKPEGIYVHLIEGMRPEKSEN